MKSLLGNRGKTLWLSAFLLALFGLFLFVALRSGPLAPVPVTSVQVERIELAPALTGIGLVEARYVHKIGSVAAGRLKSVLVQPGDTVKAGQLLGEVDPVDFDERLRAQDAAIKRAQANVLGAQAQVREAEARAGFASAQAKRYSELGKSRMVSAESVESKRQEQRMAAASVSAAHAGLEATQQELAGLRADRLGQKQLRDSLQLIAPVDGVVIRREADPGTTVVAGQSVLEVVDPASLWLNVRFDQKRAQGLRAGLAAQISLRSQPEAPFAGRVARVESYADAVTEELLAKVSLIPLPTILPAIGEIAEVNVVLNTLPTAPAIPNAAVRRVDGMLGVWLLEDGDLRFMPVKLGAVDLKGRVQVLEGLRGGESIILYSRKSLSANSRIDVIDEIQGARQ
ncbi:efflux RND transporter periplasmic adaptor subunit [Arenimonas sp.]|jgi:HlyD family secretion protein|uniref:efflux RND transporter periplasmic adaptor subunit n=1 Tax=Arenimonas sp. TaxID=1872635 RepID=UPI0037BE83D1